MKQNMILLASLIVLAAALAGAGVWIYQTQIAPKSRSIIQPGLLVEKQNQIEDETASWQIYRNEEFGYEMQYPNNWRKDINPLYWNTEKHSMIFCPPESFPENNNTLLGGTGDDTNKGCGSKRRVWSVDNGNMMVEGIGEIPPEDYTKNWQGELKDPPLIYLFKTDCKKRAYDYALLGEDGQGFCWMMRNSGAPKEIFDRMVSTFKFVEPQTEEKAIEKFEVAPAEEILRNGIKIIEYSSEAKVVVLANGAAKVELRQRGGGTGIYTDPEGGLVGELKKVDANRWEIALPTRDYNTLCALAYDAQGIKIDEACLYNVILGGKDNQLFNELDNSYSGKYSYYENYKDGSTESGDLTVRQLSTDKISFDLLVVNFQSHLGDIRDGEAKLHDNIAIYEKKDEFFDEPCRLEIIFADNSATIKTISGSDSRCGFGMNVSADGIYSKKIGSAPKDFIKFAEYIPSGWQIKAKVEGDLNGDGKLDAALVVEESIERNMALEWDYCASRNCGCASQRCPRKLMLFFGKNYEDYELFLVSDKAILLADEGGAFGDPFEGLSIDNGVLSIKSYGGSAWRWAKIYKFRYQDNGWYLIGKTEDNYYNGCSMQVFQTQDFNYLTGYMKKITGDGWGEGGNFKENFDCDYSLRQESGKEEWINIGKKSLLNLKDFDPRIN